MTLAGMAERGEDATRIYALNKPDVVVIAQALTGAIDGLEATRRVREVFPKAKVVLLMASPSADNLYRALQASVSAIMPMETPIDELISVIAQVHAEDICWIEPRLARLLPSLFSGPSNAVSASKSLKKATFGVTVPSQEMLTSPESQGMQAQGIQTSGLTQSLANTTSPSGDLPQKRFASNPTMPLSPHLQKEASSTHGLTGREVDVLKLITEGRTNQDIARHLVITQNTVKTHMKNIFHKLGVSDRTGAAVKALRENLLA
jgi:DNA-binding NarL/FixJ family response regulator